MFEQLTPQVTGVFAALLGLLVIASIAVRVLAARSPDTDYTEVYLRIRTWWIMIAIVAVAICISRAATIVLMALISFLALKEFLSLIPTRCADRRVLLWLYLAIPIQYYWIGTGWFGLFIIWVPVYVFLGIPLIMVLVGETKGYLSAAGRLFWGAMTTVFALGHAAYLLMLPAGPAGSAGLLLFLILLTQLNDVAQFVWGKSIGQRKALPSVSPGKTVGGLLGGVATTTVVAVLLAPVLTPLSMYYAIIAGVVISMAGFFGDVTISAVKRDLGVKDFGTTLPGHGGILDRVDSLTYTAPLFFHLVKFVYF